MKHDFKSYIYIIYLYVNLYSEHELDTDVLCSASIKATYFTFIQLTAFLPEAS